MFLERVTGINLKYLNIYEHIPDMVQSGLCAHEKSWLISGMIFNTLCSFRDHIGPVRYP